MLAGLCNLCEDYGYSNFENLIILVKKISEVFRVDLSGIYLKSKFSNEVLFFFIINSYYCSTTPIFKIT